MILYNLNIKKLGRKHITTYFCNNNLYFSKRESFEIKFWSLLHSGGEPLLYINEKIQRKIREYEISIHSMKADFNRLLTKFQQNKTKLPQIFLARTITYITFRISKKFHH